MINLCSGLNRHLTNPPYRHVINLMRNETFKNANNVFKGQLKKNKKDGLDVSHCKTAMDRLDVEKLYTGYFLLGLADGNTEVLLHKVFFDLLYHTGCRGKEGL